MVPIMIFPGDVFKLLDNAVIPFTQKELSQKKESDLDSPQQFLLNSNFIEKGTILEVSSVVLKKRNSAENVISFKVIDGPMFSSYYKHISSAEKLDLQSSIEKLEQKLEKTTLSLNEQKEIKFEIKNRQKRLKALNSKKTKNGFTKSIKIKIEDVESWNIKIS